MVRGQQEHRESGADLGTVGRKETAWLLEIAIMARSSGKAQGDGIRAGPSRTSGRLKESTLDRLHAKLLTRKDGPGPSSPQNAIQLGTKVPVPSGGARRPPVSSKVRSAPKAPGQLWGTQPQAPQRLRRKNDSGPGKKGRGNPPHPHSPLSPPGFLGPAGGQPEPAGRWPSLCYPQLSSSGPWAPK